MRRDYVPDVGDIVWIDFDPQAGHEQAGHRPGLVLTKASYNVTRGMMIVCPMSSRIKNHPFEVLVSNDPPSVVLADQAKSIDWRTRGAKFKGRASPDVLQAAREKLGALIGL